MGRDRDGVVAQMAEKMRVAVLDNLSDGVYFVDRRRQILSTGTRVPS